MRIPFTVEQFFDIFEAYNSAIWPAQIAAYILGIAALALTFRDKDFSGRTVSVILALFWIWMGVLYHIIHFSVINPAARIFGLFYVLEGLLLLIIGAVLGRLSFRLTAKPLPIVGTCFIFYAMIVYPILGMAFGHSYPRAPVFGVAPCPTTIFTFGLFLWAAKPVPGYLLMVPLIWAIIGMSAAVNLRVPQDYGLVVAGILGTVLILVRNRKIKQGRGRP